MGEVDLLTFLNNKPLSSPSKESVGVPTGAKNFDTNDVINSTTYLSVVIRKIKKNKQ